jgi:hypothetical protein
LLKEDFLKLISILLGEEPGHLVMDNQEQIHRLGQCFNETLTINNQEEKLHTELTFEGKSYLIPPVPFASTNEQNQMLSFAFLGLNPKLFLDNDNTIREKEHAGESWEQYANFYTTINRENRDIGKFYRNLTMLMQSLKSKKLVRYSEFMEDCKDSKEKINKFNDSVEKDPLFVGEFIPLHSSKFGAYDARTVQKLFDEVPPYKPYLTELFRIIFNKLGSDGWLITNGKAASAALEMFIENNWIEGTFTKVLDKRSDAYTCYSWDHAGVYRKVLLLHEFLQITNGKLNHSDDIAEMVVNVVNAFDQLDNYSNVENNLDEQVNVYEGGEELEEVEEANRYDGFGEYAAIAERIDQLILDEMRTDYPVYRMLNISDGESYSEKPGRSLGGFVKIGYGSRNPYLLLRFGPRVDGFHIGLVKQSEIDRKLGLQKERSLVSMYNYPNEAFVYLKSIAENNNQETWDFIKQNIILAYKIYYGMIDPRDRREIIGR